jgi:hypothetical protein
MEQFISPLLTALGLMWAVYQFYIKRQDEKQAQARAELTKMIGESGESMRKEVNFIKEQFGDIRKEFDQLKQLSLASASKLDAQSNLMLAQAKIFDESIKRLEKTLDRHEQKLDAYGSVRIKG